MATQEEYSDWYNQWQKQFVYTPSTIPKLSFSELFADNAESDNDLIDRYNKMIEEAQRKNEALKKISDGSLFEAENSEELGKLIVDYGLSGTPADMRNELSAQMADLFFGVARDWYNEALAQLDPADSEGIAALDAMFSSLKRGIALDVNGLLKIFQTPSMM